MTLNIASLIKFEDLCGVFEETCVTKLPEKLKFLDSFIKKYKQEGLKLAEQDKNALISFYPAFRLILPQLERERGPYGLKEYTLAKRIIRILGLPPQDSEATQLTHFRGSDSSSKDFAECAYWILRKRFMDGSGISIFDVNKYLDSIATLHSENNPRGVDDQLYQLFRKTNAKEQKWLIRIILKDLKLGIGQNRILKLYHPDAVDLYSVNNNLSIVCNTLLDVSKRLHEIEISLFSPFRPMLSQLCNVTEFHKIFTKNNEFYIETKFDGERFQLHMENNVFKYFSRNGFEFTSSYGTNFSTGHYTPLLKNAFKNLVHSIILDGEMMGWNKKTNQFGSKGMDMDVKHLKPHNVYQPCFCIFDILFLNGNVLTNKPLHERLNLLTKVINPIQGILHVSHHIISTNKQDIINALNKSMDREEEGIIFKDIKSVYKSNDRSGGWWKMKLEYFENVMSDLDVIVIGGYYGEGKHRNRISGFLMGLANVDESNTEYLSFAKVASGLSEGELKIVEEKLGPYWRRVKDSNPEDFDVCFGKEKPDVWISPSQSCIFTVRASELIRSGDFKTNYTLRFPRILKIRLDKPIYDCMKFSELQQLVGFPKPVQKLSKRHLELSDLEIIEKEKKIKRRYVGVEMKPVEQKTNILAGFEFCILTGCQEWPKDDIEICIRENGGTVVLNEGNKTLCILVGDTHPRVNSCKEHDAQIDLVKLNWLQRILDKGLFTLFKPTDVIHASKKTTIRFLSEYDKYGDSYFDDITEDKVLDIIEEIDLGVDYINPTSKELVHFEEQLNCGPSINIFRDSIAYFSEFNKNYKIYDVSFEFSLASHIFKFLGGSIRNKLNEEVTLVVMDKHDYHREMDIREYLNSINNDKAVITNVNYIYTKFNELSNSPPKI